MKTISKDYYLINNWCVYCSVKNVVFFTKKHYYEFNTRRLVSQFEADENAVILDVRTEDEFNEGFIATP
jgi:hypothetical protein